MNGEIINAIRCDDMNTLQTYFKTAQIYTINSPSYPPKSIEFLMTYINEQIKNI